MKRHRSNSDEAAREEFQKRENKKKFHIKDLIQVYPKSQAQRDLFEAWNTHDHLVLNGSAGTGKAQPLYSKVLTKKGWKLFGELKIRDEIRSKNDWTFVTGIFPQGKKETIRFHFKDGGYC